MSEDITKELPMSTDEKIDQLFLMTRNVIQGLNQLDARMTVLEQSLASLKAGTNPFWQVMHDRQQQIWETLQDHSARLDRIEARMDGHEAHLQQQDEQLARLEEKVTVGFRKLGDKFDLLTQDYYDLHADVVDLRRRVTRLEPIN